MRLVADMVHRVATPPQLYPHSVLRQSVHGRGSLGRDVLAFLVHLRLLVLSKIDVPQQVLPVELPPHASADLIEAPGYSDLAAMAQDKIPQPRLAGVVRIVLRLELGPTCRTLAA